MNIPPPDQLPAEMNDAQIKAVLLWGITNPNYTDQCESIVSYEVISEDPPHMKWIGLDGNEPIAFEYEGGYLTFEKLPAGTQFADPQTEPDTALSYAQQLGKRARSEISAMVDAVDNLYRDSSSIDEFGTKLATLFPQLGGEQLTDVMAEALQAGHLAGMFEAYRDTHAT